MPTRRARTAWNGTVQEGSGQLELTSSKVGTYHVSFPKRAAEDADGTTSPEEMMAASHSSCYAMQFSSLVAQNGGTPQSVEVTADVTLGKDEERGGFQISGIHLTVSAEVEGLDEETFQKVVQDAKAGCPISKALAGTDITVDASME